MLDKDSTREILAKKAIVWPFLRVKIAQTVLAENGLHSINMYLEAKLIFEYRTNGQRTAGKGPNETVNFLVLLSEPKLRRI